MKKEFFISHLSLAWKFGENVLIYITNEDLQNSDPTVLMFSFRFKSFHISRLERILKLATFEKVNLNDKEIQNHYRDQVALNIPEKTILESLTTFEKRKSMSETTRKQLSSENKS
jgi:hypothetical protein